MNQRSDVAVRPAHPDDAPPLSIAHVRAWQAAYRGVIPDDYLDGLRAHDIEDGWRRRLAHPDPAAPVVVATVDGVVAGFVGYGAARDPESGDAGELHVLNVHPDHWGTGAGAALLTAAHAGLTDLGYASATLWVVPSNARARRFYERHGWRAEPLGREADMRGVTVPEVRYARRLP